MLAAGGGAKVRGEYLCVPLRYLAEVFGAQYESQRDNRMVRLTLSDGRVLQTAVARSNTTRKPASKPNAPVGAQLTVDVTTLSGYS